MVDFSCYISEILNSHPSQFIPTNFHIIYFGHMAVKTRYLELSRFLQGSQFSQNASRIKVGNLMHTLATSAEHVNQDSLPKKKHQTPVLIFSSHSQPFRAMYGDHFLHFRLPFNTMIHRATVYLRGKKDSAYNLQNASCTCTSTFSNTLSGATGIHNLSFFQHFSLR